MPKGYWGNTYQMDWLTDIDEDCNIHIMETEVNTPKMEYIDDGENMTVKIVEKFCVLDPSARGRNWFSSEESACSAARDWVRSQAQSNKHELYVVQIIKVIKPVHVPVQTFEVE